MSGNASSMEPLGGEECQTSFSTFHTSYHLPVNASSAYSAAINASQAYGTAINASSESWPAPLVMCPLPDNPPASPGTSLLMCAIGTVGNALVLFFLTRPGRRRQVREKFFYAMVAGLAVTDVTGILTSSALVLAVYQSPGRCWDLVGAMPTCHLFSTIMLTAGYATEAIAASMAAERFVAVRYPLLHRTVLEFNAHSAKLVLAVIWVCSLLLSTLPVWAFGTNIVQWPGTWCFFDSNSPALGDQAYSYVFAISGLLSMTIFLLCNSAVIVILIRNRIKWNRANQRLRDAALTTSPAHSHSSLLEKGQHKEQPLLRQLQLNRRPLLKHAESLQNAADGGRQTSIKFTDEQEAAPQSEDDILHRTKYQNGTIPTSESPEPVKESLRRQRSNTDPAVAVNSFRKYQRSLSRAVSRQKLLLATADAQISVFLLVLTVVFCVCWLPILIQTLLNALMATFEDSQRRCPRYDRNLFVIRLASVNQILDPWIYILLRKEVLSSVTRMLRAKCFPGNGLERPLAGSIDKSSYNSPQLVILRLHESFKQKAAASHAL